MTGSARTEHTRNVFAWLNQIKRDRELEGMAVAFVVAFEIQQHINHHTGQGFPGMDRIAERTGFAESTVRAAVDRLEARGHLDIERGRGRGHSHRYRMIIKPQPAAVLERIKQQPDAVLQSAQNRSQPVRKTAASENKTAAGPKENRSYPAANNLKEQPQGTTEHEQGRAESAPMGAHAHAPAGDFKKSEGKPWQPNPNRLRKGDAIAMRKLCVAWEQGKLTEAELEREEAKIKAHARNRPDDDWPDDFKEQFWGAYPHQVGEKPALAELAKVRRRKRNKPTWSELMDGVRRYLEYRPYDQKWMNPKNWLAEDRWNDRPAGLEAARERRRVLDAMAEQRFIELKGEVIDLTAEELK
jgi:DNA-binding MarR family transcriptional regulator